MVSFKNVMKYGYVLFFSVLLLLFLIGCGDDSTSPMDGAVHDGSPRDSGEDGGGSDGGQPLPHQPVFEDHGIVFEHRYEVQGYEEVVSPASDPSVIHIDGTLYMSFTCVSFSETPPATILCLAYSDDGLSWTTIPSSTSVPGEIRRGTPGTERARLEGSALVASEEGQHLFYSHYPDPVDAAPAEGYPADLVVVTGDVEQGFGDNATLVMERTVDGIDHHAIYSPTFAYQGDTWSQVYSAHCFPQAGPNCPLTPGGVILAVATADTLDGPFTKKGPVVFEDGHLDLYPAVFLAEASLITTEDRAFLFVTGFNPQEKPISLGLATSDSPLGTFELQGEPLLTASEVDAIQIVAPSVLVEDGRFRMWYTHIQEDGIQRIAYAESQ